MASQTKLGRTNTTIMADPKCPSDILIRYHETDVVRFNPQTIFLRLDRASKTEKDRINQAAAQFCLPVGVCIRRGDWYVTTADQGGTVREFRWPECQCVAVDRATGELTAVLSSEVRTVPTAQKFETDNNPFRPFGADPRTCRNGHPLTAGACGNGCGNNPNLRAD